MKKLAKLLVLIITISLLSGFNTYAGDEDSEDEVVRTITEVNELRDSYGLPLLSYNKELNTAAETHNRYMDINKTYSSIEDDENLFYRGRYPWDRALYAGYKDPYVFEALMKDSPTYLGGINALLDNPYSRYAVLDPLYEDIGMNTYNGYSTFLFGGIERTDNYEVVYPYDGMTGLDTTFVNKYVIDPYNNVETEAESVGIPVTYTIYTSEANVESYEDVEATITNTSTGEDIEVAVVTSINDKNLTNTLMILPLEPYEYGTTYEVDLEVRVRFSDSIKLENDSYWRYYNKTWEFTTEASITASDEAYVTREKFVEDLIKDGGYKIENTYEIIFTDVNHNAPNYKYIYTAYVNELIKGYGNGLYKPNANISVEQVYTILMRSFEHTVETVTLEEEDMELNFADKDLIAGYALNPMYKAKKIGLLADNEEEIGPGEYITISDFEAIMKTYNQILQKYSSDSDTETEE